jgi:hypothetical protein
LEGGVSQGAAVCRRTDRREATPYDHIAQAIYRVFRLVRKAYRATQSHIEPREDFRARYIDYFFDGTLPIFFIVISTVIRDTQPKYNRSVIDFLR